MYGHGAVYKPVLCWTTVYYNKDTSLVWNESDMNI